MRTVIAVLLGFVVGYTIMTLVMITIPGHRAALELGVGLPCCMLGGYYMGKLMGKLYGN